MGSSRLRLVATVAFTLTIHLEARASNDQWSWRYECDPDVGGCHRAGRAAAGHASTRNGSAQYPTVDQCRAVCGRYSTLWPRPAWAALARDTVQIHPDIVRFDDTSVPSSARSLLAEMTHLFLANIRAECGVEVKEPATASVVVYLSVDAADTRLDLDTDERYTLDIQREGGEVAVHIEAKTVYGARHGLESLSHLVTPTLEQFPAEETARCGLSLVSGGKIKDAPAYKYRGLLLDTSRNFIPMADIMRTIDGMAATKLNVFHWHVTDSHSFPLVSPRVPELARYGAYSPAEVYTPAEVRALVRHARARGVRVVLELDAPAHAGNGWQWGESHGYGALAVCVNAAAWRRLCVQPPCGQLNPANPRVYDVLARLYRDVADALPPRALLHMGGDEVFFPCWNSSEEITAYLRRSGREPTREGFLSLWSEFQREALARWDAAGGGGQPVLMWSSELTRAQHIEKHLNKDRYIIEVWERTDSSLLDDLLKLGYRAVTVPKNVWYLDWGSWGVTAYSNWRRMYEHYLPRDPNMLGGEVAMWSEYVDAQGLDTRVWPRAAAVAERLWADPAQPAAAAAPRLDRLRRRLLARRLRPDVLHPAWCADNDGRCQ